MNRHLTTDQISRALFESDPMHTCCKENDCYDEYDYVAEDVSKRLQKGQDLAPALQPVINELEGANHDR